LNSGYHNARAIDDPGIVDGSGRFRKNTKSRRLEVRRAGQKNNLRKNKERVCRRFARALIL
jgi:hypothetical protein